MNYTDQLQLTMKISQGGKWLSVARSWMQSNVHKGDTLPWNSAENVTIPFYKLEEFAKRVAIAAVMEYKENNNVG